MVTSLYAYLEAVIENWINDNCEEENWPEVIVGRETGQHMAKAAAAVFDGICEAEKYAEDEGYFTP